MYKSGNVIEGVFIPVLVWGNGRWNENYLYDIETLSAISINKKTSGGVILKAPTKYILNQERAELTDKIEFLYGNKKDFPLDGHFKEWTMTWKLGRLNEAIALYRCADGTFRYVYKWIQNLLELDNFYTELEGKMSLYFYPMGKKDNKYEVLIDDLNVSYSNDIPYANAVRLTLISKKPYKWNTKSYYDKTTSRLSRAVKAITRSKLTTEKTQEYACPGINYYVSKQLNITYPNNGGITLTVGQTCDITWTCGTAISGNINIYKTTDNGLNRSQLNMIGINCTTGTYSWVVSGSGSSNKILLSNGTHGDISNRSFTINNPS